LSKICFEIDEHYIDLASKYIGKGKKFSSISSYCRSMFIEKTVELDRTENLYKKKDE